MKVLLDACVLYPTLCRDVLLRVAKGGGFTPLWSPRILEEWARAARKAGPTGELQARSEIALVRADWPRAEVTPGEGTLARLWLPDPDDIHVLAAAVDGHADILLTFNAKDFPRNILAEEGVERQDPDGLMMAIHAEHPDLVRDAAIAAHQEAVRHKAADATLRASLKRARMPRLGKALSQD